MQAERYVLIVHSAEWMVKREDLQRAAEREAEYLGSADNTTALNSFFVDCGL